MDKIVKVARPHGHGAKIQIPHEWLGKPVRATRKGPEGKEESIITEGRSSGTYLLLKNEWLGSEVTATLDENEYDVRARIILDALRDDLIMILEDLLKDNKIKDKDLVQLKYEVETLKPLIGKMLDVDLTKECLRLLETARKVLGEKEE